MLKWYCRLCLRGGNLDFIGEDPEETAKREHRIQVNEGLNPSITPGITLTPDTPIMEKYKGVDCVGDIRIGDAPKKNRKRIKPGMLPFPDEEDAEESK